MAATYRQGRGVLIDLHQHFGDERVSVGFDDSGTCNETRWCGCGKPGDMLVLHTGGRLCFME